MDKAETRFLLPAGGKNRKLYVSGTNFNIVFAVRYKIYSYFVRVCLLFCQKRRNFVAAICRYYASNSNKRINYTVYEEYRTFHQKRRPCVGEGL